MALFEQRISAEDVTAARKKIAAGSSLRSAAATIPCAPSTLSVRIRKAEQAEANALARAGIRGNGQRAAQPGEPHALAAWESGDVGPVETLRGALLATKASGQPDWPTRVSAAKALAALRPEEVEPKTEDESAPSIVVYDLPPGTNPVLHRAPNELAAAPVSPAEAPSEQRPTCTYLFFYEPAEGESDPLGTWTTANLDRSTPTFVQAVLRSTDDRETAELWRAQLAAGRLPQDTEDAP
jgi:hypothetical protein